MIKRGDTFLMPESSGQKEHLYIVLTDPEPETGKAACVNITSRKSTSETTLILNKGDHPFIDHESVVWYGRAQILSLSLIEKLLNMRTDEFVCVKQEPCSADLLKRICDGLLRSEDVEHGVKSYCKTRWGIH